MTIIENEYSLPEDVKKWAEDKEITVLRNRDIASVDDEYIVEYSPESSLRYLEMIYCHSKNLPAVITETERLVIKEISDKDLESYRELIELNREVLKDSSLSGLSAGEFKIRHDAYIKYSYHFMGYGIWGIFLKDNGFKNKEMIGIAGIDGAEPVELSYALFEKYRGLGYAYEACCTVLEMAQKDYNIDKIVLSTYETNVKSVALAKKLKTKYPFLALTILQE